MKRDPSGYWGNLGVKFSPDQPRDAYGRWTTFGSASPAAGEFHPESHGHMSSEYYPMTPSARDKYSATMALRLEGALVKEEGHEAFHYDSPLLPPMISAYFKQDGWKERSEDGTLWEKGNWSASIIPEFQNTRVVMRYNM